MSEQGNYYVQGHEPVILGDDEDEDEDDGDDQEDDDDDTNEKPLLPFWVPMILSA
jgi:hypothetical protein